LFLGLLFLGSCEASQQSTLEPSASAFAAHVEAFVKPQESRMWMIVGERRFTVTLTDSASGYAFAEMLPLTLDMPDLNGNEKHAKLPKALPANPTSPGMIRDGDLMLYGAHTLVVFYKTFASPYSYSRLGRVDDPVGLALALGENVARIEFLKSK
jgi:hypothetical protein